MSNYFIYDKTNVLRSHSIEASDTEEVKHWIINHLDLSVEWVVHKGYGLDGKKIDISIGVNNDNHNSTH